jgi:uncharacterized repeat protein (TIGR01451 family)
MKTAATRFVFCAAILAVLSATVGASTITLEVFNNDFGMAPSTHIDPLINVGDTVRWVWNSDGVPHSTQTAAGQADSWDSGIHTTPFTFEHTFAQTGTFNYFCIVHGFDAGNGQVGGMSGHVVVLGPPAELDVTKSVAPTSVSPGGTLTYTIAVANHSATNATNVTLTDALPANTTFVSADAACTQSAGVVTCDLGTLAAGASATVTVVVAASPPGPLCNSATVIGELSDVIVTNHAGPACASVVSHNLAVIAIKAPKVVALTDKKPAQTKFVRVTIQNRGDHPEMIMDAGVLANLVTLELESTGTNCVAPEAELVVGPPQRPLPVMLKPKQKFTAVFSVTYDCANDRLKGPGHEDYEYYAAVHHEAIDGQPDSQPADDDCPHNAIGGPFKDKGCGGKKDDGTRGEDVLTDVTVK